MKNPTNNISGRILICPLDEEQRKVLKNRFKLFPAAIDIVWVDDWQAAEKALENSMSSPDMTGFPIDVAVFPAQFDLDLQAILEVRANIRNLVRLARLAGTIPIGLAVDSERRLDTEVENLCDAVLRAKDEIDFLSSIMGTQLDKWLEQLGEAKSRQ